MATPQEVLRRTLLKLGKKEFKTFKSLLNQEGGLEGFESIPKSKLEDADDVDTMEQMVNTYTPINALKVTKMVLEKIPRNDLVEEISRTIKELTAAQQKMENQTNQNIYPVDEKTMKSRVALLITNIHFADERFNRKGAEKDEENMERLLSDYRYEVVKHRYLTAKGIDDALINFSGHPKLKETDSVLVVIMSHGKLGAVLGVNHGETSTDEFPINNIYKHLGSEECPALLNKPKIIIIEACRGDKEGGVLVQDADRDLASDSGPLPGAESDMEEDAWRFVHREKDFISLLSSTPDTVSYRNTVQGSLLIQYVVDVFKTFARNDHIEELFRKVMQRFENFQVGHRRQMPTKDRCTLTKRFYFFPRY